jgi:hypothetical protein
VAEWQEKQRELAKREGYVCTILGRRRQLPDAKPGSSSKALVSAAWLPLICILFESMCLYVAFGCAADAPPNGDGWQWWSWYFALNWGCSVCFWTNFSQKRPLWRCVCLK